jgi:hypothetical protein
MLRAVFIPLTDALIAEHPEVLDGHIVPYHPDLPCYRELATQEPGADAAKEDGGED